MSSTIHCPHCEQEIAAGEQSCPACGHIHGEHIRCTRHPDSMAGGICVICGDAVCKSCDAGETVHHACPVHRDVSVIEGWAQIYSTSDAVEAELIKENLQSEGIDAAVLSQKDRSFAVDLGELSPVRILVPAYEYLSATTLLSSHMDIKGEVSFACPACGEAYEEGDTSCRTCGAPLPTVGGTEPPVG
jgi:predicted RNA-binding Zn-ribbon protein involved in translation (DUF1610 family)